MNNTKHTPGPWNIYFNSQDNFVIRKMFEDGTESHVIAICHSGFENARLIATAPKLLESLQEIIAAADGDGWSQLDPSLSKARAAIAKAQGNIQQASPEDVEEEDENPDNECPYCAGTGEGQYDGQSCGVCRGKGFIRN